MEPPDWLTDPLMRNAYETIARSQRDISYADWLDHWFGKPVVSQYFPWFHEVPEGIFQPELVNAYAHRVFVNAPGELERFSDDQIGAGLYLLISDDDIYLAHPDVPIAQRQACLLAVADLFRDLFAGRCAQRLSSGAHNHSIINGTCYMWWEIMTHVAWPGDPGFERMKQSCLQVMEKSLAIPHIAVQESALHGLGHLVRDSDAAALLIDRFLAKADGVDPDLLRYARSAACGCIQ